MKRDIAKTLMLQGTASDVGKSLLTAALCRILWQDGLKVAPFKSQNMSLNSYVTPDGKEIGRAQGMQADACKMTAVTDMNPILLKPKKDMVSQVVVHGKPYRDLDARTYREKYLPEAEVIVQEALHRLRSRTDVVLIEGAGSPAEINLKDRDIVNMRLAGWADAPVLLVADIDRGGVFASIVGTLEILTPDERDRVKGFIINKFRGDISLLQPGLDWLEEKTGKPVIGVVPYLPNVELEDEDSASLDTKAKQTPRLQKPIQDQSVVGASKLLDIAVIRFPRISNFTDLDPLEHEPDVQLRFVERAEHFGQPDAVILPGSKNTVDDLLFLRESGLDKQLLEYIAEEGRCTGICAGFQMMGKTLLDPNHVESDKLMIEGLGIFPMETTFVFDKKTVRVAGTAEMFGENFPIEGYEIHMGHTLYQQSRTDHPFKIQWEEPGRIPEKSDTWHGDGQMLNEGKLWGTYIHGVFQNDSFRRSWLNQIREDKGWSNHPEGYLYGERRELAFDRLAEHVRTHLNMDQIYQWIGGKQG